MCTHKEKHKADTNPTNVLIIDHLMLKHLKNNLSSWLLGFSPALVLVNINCQFNIAQNNLRRDPQPMDCFIFV